MKQKNIIHFDIKPENIVYQEQMDGKLDFFLIDFGSALFFDGKAHFVDNTVNYTAPEILQSRKRGFPVDIWSIGVVLAQLIGGQQKQLFFGDVSSQVLKNIQKKFGTSVNTYSFTKDPCINSLLQQMLETDPQRRISAETFHQEVHSHFLQL